MRQQSRWAVWAALCVGIFIGLLLVVANPGDTAPSEPTNNVRTSAPAAP